MSVSGYKLQVSGNCYRLPVASFPVFASKAGLFCGCQHLLTDNRCLVTGNLQLFFPPAPEACSSIRFS